MDLSLDYFALFQLPRAFAIDGPLLEERYRSLQQSVHPDRHTGATAQEQRLAMQYATYVNEAHVTLKSPLARAIYLLELAGCSIEENPTLEPAFLMQQIELREALEEVDSESAVADFVARVDVGIRTHEANFAGAIESSNKDAIQAVYKLQFLHKLRAEAQAVEERILGY